MNNKVSFFMGAIMLYVLAIGLPLHACCVDLAMAEIEQYAGKSFKFDVKHNAQKEHYDLVSLRKGTCTFEGKNRYSALGVIENGFKGTVYFEVDTKNPKFKNKHYTVYQGKIVQFISQVIDVANNSRFSFKDQILEKVNSKDMNGLECFLKNNPGKSIIFSPNQRDESLLYIKDMIMFLVLMRHQQKVEEYQQNLRDAIQLGSPQYLSDFLKKSHGYDVNFVYDNKQTPLECAVCSGNIEKVKILIEETGAVLDQDLQNKLWFIALLNKNDDMMNYLSLQSPHDNGF